MTAKNKRPSMLLRVPAYRRGVDTSLLSTWIWDERSPDEPMAIDQIRAELASWKGTPHRAGQQRKGAPGGGVDCTHFVAAVLDWAYESAGCASSLREIGPLPRSAQDLGVHRDCLGSADDPKAGAAWWFAKRYPLRVVTLDEAQTLDLVVIEVAGGANHLGIMGPVRPTDTRECWSQDLWHASGGAGGVVCRASLADAALRRRVRTVFRPCVGARS